ncbi:hypothetical protein ACLB1S_28935 [Escherichia coli]
MKDPLSCTAGVGSVQLFGSEYAMRIWADRKLNNTNWYLPMLFPRLRCKTTRFPVVNWVACHRRQTSN